MQTKAQLARADRLRKNSEWLLGSVRSKFLERGYQGDCVERCIRSSEYDFSTIKRDIHPISIRFNQNGLVVLAFKRNSNIADPPELDNALMYIIENPPF